MKAMKADKADMEVVHVKLPKDLVKGIDHVAVDEEAYRQDIMGRLLAWALGEYHKHGKMPEAELI